MLFVTPSLTAPEQAVLTKIEELHRALHYAVGQPRLRCSSRASWLGSRSGWPAPRISANSLAHGPMPGDDGSRAQPGDDAAGGPEAAA